MQGARGGHYGMTHSIKKRRRLQILQLFFGFFAGATLATVLMTVLFYRDFFPPTPTLAPTVPALPLAEAARTALPPVDKVIVLPTETPLPTTVIATETIATAQQPILIPSATAYNRVTLVPTDRIIAVGDSVMLGGALELKKLLGDLDLDARVGRQPAAAIDVLRARHAAGQIRSMR